MKKNGSPTFQNYIIMKKTEQAGWGDINAVVVNNQTRISVEDQDEKITINKLKNRKIPGICNVSNEMVKYAGTAWAIFIQAHCGQNNKENGILENIKRA